jgi:hypothetical protein
MQETAVRSNPEVTRESDDNDVLDVDEVIVIENRDPEAVGGNDDDDEGDTVGGNDDDDEEDTVGGGDE